MRSAQTSSTAGGGGDSVNMQHAFSPLQQQLDDSSPISSPDRNGEAGEILNFDSIEVGGPGLGDGTTSEDDVRLSRFEVKLRGIFLQHDPDRLCDVPKLLRKYEGTDKEDMLVARLEKKVCLVDFKHDCTLE